MTDPPPKSRFLLACFLALVWTLSALLFAAPAHAQLAPQLVPLQGSHLPPGRGTPLQLASALNTLPFGVAAQQPTPTSTGQPQPVASQLPDLIFTLAVGLVSLVIVIYLLVRRYRQPLQVPPAQEEQDPQA